MSFTCTDKDALIAFLYDECDEATRHAVTAHVATCRTCADEVRGFAHVRETLSRWAPPDRVSGYRLVRDDVAGAPATTATVLRPARWWQAPVSVMARVAAAVLLFAGGAALANLDVRYDKDGFAVRTGWRPAAPTAASQAAAANRQSALAVTPISLATPSAGQGESPWRGELTALERSLRDDFRQQLAAARASGGASPAGVSGVADAGGEARFMNQVRALIDESYRRQQVEMAYRVSLLEREVQGQRKADNVRAQPAFSQFDGPPIYAPEQRQMINYIRLNPVTLKK